MRKGDKVTVIKDICGDTVTQRLIGLQGTISDIREDIDPEIDGTVYVKFRLHPDPIIFYEEELEVCASI